MKYGQTLQKQSVPQWAVHNIDYNDVKYIIKTQTTKGQGRSGSRSRSREPAKAISIPGQGIDESTTLQSFENDLYGILVEEHQRINLFVQSKAGEIQRRLDHVRKRISRLGDREPASTQTPASVKRLEKYSRAEDDVLKVGEEIDLLNRFIHAQRLGFQKLLKKYRRWTGSGNLGRRFSKEVLERPSSFTRRDLGPLSIQYDQCLASLKKPTSRRASGNLRTPQLTLAEPPSSTATTETASSAFAQIPSSSSSSVPEHSDIPGVASTPRAPRKKKKRNFKAHPLRNEIQQTTPPGGGARYWNEFDDGSEVAEPNTYVIYCDQEESSFFGKGQINAIGKAIANGMDSTKRKAKEWLKPMEQKHEHQGLLESESVSNSDESNVGDDSSEEHPFISQRRYSTFPSLPEYRSPRSREILLFRSYLGFLIAAYALLLVCTILATTGRRKLHLEVELGVIVGVTASLVFAVSGVGLMFLRRDRLGWLHWFTVLSAFGFVCIASGVLLALVGSA